AQANRRNLRSLALPRRNSSIRCGSVHRSHSCSVIIFSPRSVSTSLASACSFPLQCKRHPGGPDLMAAPIIEADKLSKIYRVFQKKEGFLGAVRGLFRRQYKEVRAVDGVSFTIEPGEMVAFLGPNGAGKTTTLKMLSGLIFPSGGSARV